MVHATLFHKGRHVTIADVYEAKTRCPICESTNNRKKVIDLQDSPHIYLLMCNKCYGISASHMPKKETLNYYYKSYYAEQKKEQINLVTFHNMKRFAKHLLKYINISDFSEERKIRILDYGGGDGTLSIMIAQDIIKRLEFLTVDILLIDYNKEINFKSDKIQFSYSDQLSDAHEKFDIVICSAVLEHITELHEVLNDLFKLVSEKGYFYARTPYITPFMKIIKNIDFTYPAHVHDLGPMFWNNIINTFSLKAKIILSRPSINETQLSRAFFRTLAAFIFKFPAYIETTIFKNRKSPIWKFVGGWEFILKMGN